MSTISTSTTTAASADFTQLSAHAQEQAFELGMEIVGCAKGFNAFKDGEIISPDHTATEIEAWLDGYGRALVATSAPHMGHAKLIRATGDRAPTANYGAMEYAKVDEPTRAMAKRMNIDIWHNNDGLAAVLGADKDMLVDDLSADALTHWLDGYSSGSELVVPPSALAGTSLQMPAVDKARDESYVGITTKPDGTPECHIILLGATMGASMTWLDASNWADEHGGELPNLREMALICAATNNSLPDVIYWTGEQHRKDGDYFCCLNVMTGKRLNAPAACSAMAVAVRRVPIVEVGAALAIAQGGAL